MLEQRRVHKNEICRNHIFPEAASPACVPEAVGPACVPEAVGPACVPEVVGPEAVGPARVPEAVGPAGISSFPSLSRIEVESKPAILKGVQQKSRPSGIHAAGPVDIKRGSVAIESPDEDVQKP